MIYVSGPYSAPTHWERVANVNRAIDIAAEIARRGHYPFVPHLSHWSDERFRDAGLELPWDWWLTMDVKMLPAFDALFLIAESKGATVEKFAAITLGLTIYTDVDEVPWTE